MVIINQKHNLTSLDQQHAGLEISALNHTTNLKSEVQELCDDKVGHNVYTSLERFEGRYQKADLF